MAKTIIQSAQSHIKGNCRIVIVETQSDDQTKQLLTLKLIDDVDVNVTPRGH